jgi:alpha-L-fucosidase
MAAYEPTLESLSTHAVPDWFADAKLGIFVHWGLYSVPAWAPTEGEQRYAERYGYFMYQADSPWYDYHRETWGADVGYYDFAEQWQAENWDPERWAAFFDDIGARYVVMTAEHHDGFPLWPSMYNKYNAAEMGPERDLIGETCAAVRDRGLRFCPSFHANWNHNHPPVDGIYGHPDFDADDGPGPEYVDYMNAKHRELIRRYEPDLLWFDAPQLPEAAVRANDLIADYYNRAGEWGKEVAVNHRAATDNPASVDDPNVHADFVTPEYEVLDEIQAEKWETCRGIGHSFGYNRAEGSEHHLSGAELIEYLVDVVSKNGNLLINVGPRADGTIPDLQREPLAALGAWLDVNGEAIYGTSPWCRAGMTLDTAGGPVDARFTWRDGTLYVVTFDWPGPSVEVPLDSLDDPSPNAVRHLGPGNAGYRSTDDGVRVTLPDNPPSPAPAYALAIDGLAPPD